MAPSHSLNICWLRITTILLHSHEDNLKIILSKLLPYPLRANGLNHSNPNIIRHVMYPLITSQACHINILLPGHAKTVAACLHRYSSDLRCRGYTIRHLCQRWVAALGSWPLEWRHWWRGTSLREDHDNVMIVLLHLSVAPFTNMV